MRPDHPTPGFKHGNWIMFGRATVPAIILVFALALPGAAAPLTDKPVQYAESGVWYELVRVRRGKSVRGPGIAAMNWFTARLEARSRVWRGMRGRLAVVTDGELNRFLRTTFQPDGGAWIGLRYYCELGRLTWVDGTVQRKYDYSNWAYRWNEGEACRGSDVAPVYVSPIREGFVWRAQGHAKEMNNYFIEYRPVEGQDVAAGR